jgi:hypothetical protein
MSTMYIFIDNVCAGRKIPLSIFKGEFSVATISWMILASLCLCIGFFFVFHAMNPLGSMTTVAEFPPDETGNCDRFKVAKRREWRGGPQRT